MEEIRSIGIELNNVKKDAVTSKDWREFNRLLDDEKMVLEAINAPMPTDPAALERVRETNAELENIVLYIDKYAASLDDAANKNG